MNSRMDKYNTSESQIRSRTQKNRELYEEIRNSALTDFNVNSNMSVIEENAEKIDVGKVRRMLDQRYSSTSPKRRSIELPVIEEPVVEEQLVDTKEYDINAIIAKAKQGKNVDYNKERLKKVREAQYEILNNLDLELKKVEEVQNDNKNREAEENLMTLINTITGIEIRNKTTNLSKESSQALELLSDLKDDEPEPSKEESVETKKSEDTQPKVEEKSGSREDHIEETLSKLDIDMSAYDDFKDISKQDKSSIILKIIIFVIVIALVIGAVYILDNILNLGLLG